MKKKAILPFVILLNIFFINISSGQSFIKQIKYTQNDFEKNKISQEVYQLRWYKNVWLPNIKDTLPYFVDDRNYKGIVNYGVTFRNKDFTGFQFLESTSMCFLKVQITKCNYSQKDSIINIEGFVTGQLNDQLKNGKIQNNIELFIGEKTDTINSYYFGNACYNNIIDKKVVEAKLDNQEIDEFTVLDKFPAFYFKNYSQCSTNPKGPHPFKISRKVNKNTLFVIGSRAHYSEIFDLGSMIYYPNKNRENNQTKKQGESNCRILMIRNKLVSDIEKEKSQKQEINYYSYTQMAENYILAKKYAKAKEQYYLLYQKYPSQLFARDIHNAIRCAIQSRDFKTAFWWGEKFAFKGAPLPYFNSTIFNGLRKNPQWKSFCIKYDSIYKSSKNKQNLKFKEEIDDLVKEDQANYGLKNRKDPKILFETTERVTDKLIQLLKKEGYPSEEKIGCYFIRDTILMTDPDFYVLIRHALQQRPKNLSVLNELLDKNISTLEFDRKRSSIDVEPANSCLHIYKGNLYNSKACIKNDLIVRKIIFKFNNPYSFLMEYANFIVSEYNPENPKEWDDYYEKNFDFITKLTDDWKSFEK